MITGYILARIREEALKPTFFLLMITPLSLASSTDFELQSSQPYRQMWGTSTPSKWHKHGIGSICCWGKAHARNWGASDTSIRGWEAYWTKCQHIAEIADDAAGEKESPLGLPVSGNSRRRLCIRVANLGLTSIADNRLSNRWAPRLHDRTGQALSLSRSDYNF